MKKQSTDFDSDSDDSDSTVPAKSTDKADSGASR